MNEVLKIILEFIIAYLLVFAINYLFFVRKKTKYNKNKVPVEYYYLVSLYRLNEKNINYKHFVYMSALINSFIIVSTYMIVSKLLNKWLWQLIIGIIVIILLIIICYGMLGRYYQKRGKKNV